MSNKSITLPKEQWQAAAGNLKTAAPILANVLRTINHEGQGDTDAEDFENDMMMAISAMHYVAEFATDKCRFMALPKRKGQEE